MKNIVVCCDGTGAKYDARSKNTNVVRLFERLASDNAQQISYYDPGIGTYSSLNTGPGRWLSNALSAASGIGVIGTGLKDEVQEAYDYLMDYYEPEDKIFLFGYSRGAYTVRVLAGLLLKCGLLTKGSDNLIPYVTNISDNVANDFKRTFSRHCEVHFIGVWDTVASIGWVRRRYFRNTTLDKGIHYAYQALSLDERRRPFRASLWNEGDVPDGQTIEQVWFPGCHADVGGQNANRGISDITLEWMLTHAQRRGLRLKEGWRETLSPNSWSTFTRSDRYFWRLFSKDRSVPDGAKIHHTVFERKNNPNINYRPSNIPENHVKVD